MHAHSFTDYIDGKVQPNKERSDCNRMLAQGRLFQPLLRPIPRNSPKLPKLRLPIAEVPLLLLCYLNIVHFLALSVYTIIRVGHGFSIF
jgi:hypothetical protein